MQLIKLSYIVTLCWHCITNSNMYKYSYRLLYVTSAGHRIGVRCYIGYNLLNTMVILACLQLVGGSTRDSIDHVHLHVYQHFSFTHVLCFASPLHTYVKHTRYVCYILLCMFVI